MSAPKRKWKPRKGFDCLPTCDSFSHEELCPLTNPQAAWRQMQQAITDLTTDRDRLREAFRAAAVTRHNGQYHQWHDFEKCDHELCVAARAEIEGKGGQ